MPVLPTFADLQGRDPVASRGVPTTPTDPTGAAWAGFGDSLSKAGYGVAGTAQHLDEKADKFAAETAFIRFQDDQSKQLDELQRSAAPGGAGISSTATENFKKNGDAFFSTLPASVRAEYGPKLARLETDVASSARSFEIKAGEAATVNLVNDSLGRVTNRLAGAADADSVKLVMQEGRMQGESVIDTAPLTPIQKEEAKRSWRVASAEAAVKRMLEIDPAVAKSLLGAAQLGASDTSAAGLLKRFEGYKATPYWDLNADRVGYGSDTITLADGTVKRVTKDMVVTKADADRDLARRIPEFQAGIVRDVGADAWGKLSPNAQAALTSVAYNYGSLPKGVAAAVKTGDTEAIASSVGELQVHNDGVNAKRRLSEADIIRGGGGFGQGVSGDPLLADLPFAKRTALYADADRKIAERQSVASTESTRVYNASLNDLQTKIIDGSAGLTDIQAARDSGWLKDAGTISQVNGMVAQRDKKVADITAFNKQIADPAFSWNPFESKHIDAADAGFASMGGDLNSLQYIVDKTKIMPTSAGIALRGAFISNDPKKVANAAIVASNLLAKNPNVFTSINGASDIENDALKYQHDTEHWGMKPEDAARRIIESKTPEYKAKVAARLKVENVDEIIKKQGADGTLLSDVRSHFDPSWFIGKPSLEGNVDGRSGALSDYGEMLKEKYLKTADGDMSLAKKQALAELNKIWGVTQINGKDIITRFPPEKAPAYEGIENPGDRIAAHAIKVIKDNAGVDVKRSDIRLEVIPGRTPQQFMNNQPPQYLLTYKDKNGVDQLVKDGQAFYADPAAMRAEQTAEREAKAKKITDDLLVSRSARDLPPELKTKRDDLLGRGPIVAAENAAASAAAQTASEVAAARVARGVRNPDGRTTDIAGGVVDAASSAIDFANKKAAENAAERDRQRERRGML